LKPLKQEWILIENIFAQGNPPKPLLFAARPALIALPFQHHL